MTSELGNIDTEMTAGIACENGSFDLAWTLDLQLEIIMLAGFSFIFGVLVTILLLLMLDAVRQKYAENDPQAEID